MYPLVTLPSKYHLEMPLVAIFVFPELEHHYYTFFSFIHHIRHYTGTHYFQLELTAKPRSFYRIKAPVIIIVAFTPVPVNLELIHSTLVLYDISNLAYIDISTIVIRYIEAFKNRYLRFPDL